MSGTAIAQDHLVTLISFLDMKVMNVPRVTVPNAWQYVDDQGKLIMESIYPHLEKTGKSFCEFHTGKMLIKQDCLYVVPFLFIFSTVFIFKI